MATIVYSDITIISKHFKAFAIPGSSPAATSAGANTSTWMPVEFSSIECRCFRGEKDSVRKAEGPTIGEMPLQDIGEHSLRILTNPRDMGERPTNACVNVSPALIVSGTINSTTGPRNPRLGLGRTPTPSVCLVRSTELGSGKTSGAAPSGTHVRSLFERVSAYGSFPDEVRENSLSGHVRW